MLLKNKNPQKLQVSIVHEILSRCLRTYKCFESFPTLNSISINSNIIFIFYNKM